MSLLKAVLSALLCSLALSAVCNEPTDETSLVQVKQRVLSGSERIPNVIAGIPTPVTTWKAVAESTPANLDEGQVQGAFANNQIKIRDALEEKAASDIDFANANREERKTSRVEAQDKIKALQASVDEQIKADRDAVARTVALRNGVVGAATDRVKAAKEVEEAHHLKTLQAEKAAILGRVVGNLEGKDTAHRAWTDYKVEAAREINAQVRARARARIAAAKAMERAFVNRNTEAMALRAEVMADRSHKRADAVAARAAARASIAEERIEGPEGLKNRLTEEKAGQAVNRYAWDIKHMQEGTDAAAAGIWPLGDWPVGP